MSKLYITCWRSLGHDDFAKPLQMPAAPPLKEMALEIGRKAEVSDPFPEYCTFISVKADADCCLAFGAEPKAHPGLHKMESGELRYYGVQTRHRISVIASED